MKDVEEMLRGEEKGLEKKCMKRDEVNKAQGREREEGTIGLKQ